MFQRFKSFALKHPEFTGRLIVFAVLLLFIGIGALLGYGVGLGQTNG